MQILYLDKGTMESRKRIKDTLKGFGMSQLINEPTGIAKSTSTLIDVILSTHPPNISLTKVIQLGISDHVMRKMDSLRFQALTSKCSSYTKYKKETFNKDLKMASWDSILKSSDVNSAWNGFKSTFLDICDRHAPLLTKKELGYQNPWMTSATSNLMKTRDFYLRKVKKSGRDGTGILIDHIEIKSQLL